jgi:glycosyltransferase involved in cell wall biosynthesis
MLKEAVASVLAQTYRPIEIIISDDGSTDETGRVADELASKHPDIIRTIHRSNRGPGPAREAGRLTACGEYIQYLDSDDLLMPTKFEDQVKALRENPECGVAYGITRLTDMKGHGLKSPFKWTAEKIDFLFPKLLVDRWWCTHTPLYRRSVCDAVGPWTDLRYSQDWEYDGRVGALGTKLVNCNTHVSDHRTHADLRQTGSGKWLSAEQQVRFFQLMYEHAICDGQTPGQAEMRHFSRWVFSQARKVGARGHLREAESLYGIAREANGSSDWSMRIVYCCAKVLGWKVTGRLCQLRDFAPGANKGKDSMRLAWME